MIAELLAVVALIAPAHHHRHHHRAPAPPGTGGAIWEPDYVPFLYSPREVQEWLDEIAQLSAEGVQT